jgi:hypothetical protein
MSAVLDLLVELHNSGIHLRAVSDEELEYEGPEDLVNDEVVAILRNHKAELLELLKWDEERAYALIREALGHLAKRYAEGSDLSALDPWEDLINEAYSGEDMGSLRVAVRGFVRAGLTSFAEAEEGA